jgi:membrane protease YdiL (CAAX protease family)
MVQLCVQARSRRKLVSFLLLVALFSAAIAALQVYVPSGTRLFLIPWSPFVADALKMWSVGIAGLLVLLAIDRSLSDLGLNLCRPFYLIIAAAVPLIYCIMIYVPVWLFELGEFRGGRYLAVRLLLVPLHLPLSLLLATGEEIGWRGVLVPNLARTSGFATTALVPGLVWAVWHWPDIILFGYSTNAGTAYALSCFSMALIGLGVFLTWLRLASKSFWPTVVFHGVHNTLIWGVFDAATQNGRFTVYFTTEFGMGLPAAAAVIAYICWLNRAAAQSST